MYESTLIMNINISHLHSSVGCLDDEIVDRNWLHTKSEAQEKHLIFVRFASACREGGAVSKIPLLPIVFERVHCYMMNRTVLAHSQISLDVSDTDGDREGKCMKEFSGCRFLTLTKGFGGFSAQEEEDKDRDQLLFWKATVQLAVFDILWKKGQIDY